MNQQQIIDNCTHAAKLIKTQHGDICTSCYSLYHAAKPKRKYTHRQRVTAYGDYAIIAAINGRLNG